MLAKAANATGCKLASEPPPMATSQRPEATSLAAAAMAWVPAAQAVQMLERHHEIVAERKAKGDGDGAG